MKLQGWWGTWGDVEVVEIHDDGLVTVHWVGYSDSADEIMPRTHLQFPSANSQFIQKSPPTQRTGTKATATAPSVAPKVSTGTAEAAPSAKTLKLPTQYSGARVQAETKLSVGMQMQAWRDGQWKNVVVRGLRNDGWVLVHLQGGSDIWDGHMPRTHLQFLPKSTTGPSTGF